MPGETAEIVGSSCTDTWGCVFQRKCRIRGGCCKHMQGSPTQRTCETSRVQCESTQGCSTCRKWGACGGLQHAHSGQPHSDLIWIIDKEKIKQKTPKFRDTRKLHLNQKGKEDHMHQAQLHCAIDSQNRMPSPTVPQAVPPGTHS